MTNYPLGDFLIRIKNASLARKKEVEFPTSKLVKAVSVVLKKDGFLDEISEKGGILKVGLSYRKKAPVVLDIKLISKPGLRVYIGADDLESRKGPSGLILSTPKGILTSKDAIKARVGGEVFAEIL